MSEFLLPLPRLNTHQLNALASSLRNQAPGNDHVADSVAAALESVSRRRAQRGLLVVAGDATMTFLKGTARVGLGLADDLFEGIARIIAPQRSGAESSPRVMTASRSASKRVRTSKDLSPATIQAALHAVETGSGFSPELCEALVARGWLEWVDVEHGTPIDLNDPRSMLRMTPAGRMQLSSQSASMAA